MPDPIAGSHRAAAIYSLIKTAKLHEREPQAYLGDVLARIADHPVNRADELLPSNLHGIRLRLDQRRAA